MTQQTVRRTLSLACLGLALLAQPALAEDLIIHAGTLIDGVSDTPRTRGLHPRA